MVEDPPATEEAQEDGVSIPGWGRSPGGGHGKPPQYSCLENPRDRGAWWAAVHGVAKSRIRLSMRTRAHIRAQENFPGNASFSFLEVTRLEAAPVLRHPVVQGWRREGGEEGVQFKLMVKVGHTKKVIFDFLFVLSFIEI